MADTVEQDKPSERGEGEKDALPLDAMIILPVRQAVLRYAISSLETQFRLRIDAGRLEYNLATLSMRLAAVRIAANHTPDMPFFEADAVAVRVARSAIEN